MRRSLQPAGFAPAVVAACVDAALALRGRVPVCAFAGPPGSGKSTLAAQVARLAEARGLATTVLSLDDFYLGRGERRRLARDVHPLLVRRGPPGSHDLALLMSTLAALRRGERVPLPRFDKLADTRLPPSRWRRPRQPPALIVLEGWFLKTPAQSPAELRVPLNRLEREADADGAWRRRCNDALAGYAPLWRRIDHLTWLQPPDWDIVGDWRWQQESAALRRRPGRAGMDRRGIDDFLQVFERIGRQALRTLPAIAERTLALDSTRRPLS